MGYTSLKNKDRGVAHRSVWRVKAAEETALLRVENNVVIAGEIEHYKEGSSELEPDVVKAIGDSLESALTRLCEHWAHRGYTAQCLETKLLA